MTSAVVTAAAAAAVIAGVAPAAQAAAPVVFTFPVIGDSPVQVAGLPAGVQQVATGIGGNYGLALASGAVYGWGISYSANSFGELGDGTTVNHTSPAPVHNLSGITQIAGGGNHGLAIGAGGAMWTWGGNYSGQLGDGTTTTRLTPVRIPGPTAMIQVAGGEDYSLGLRSDGTVWSWGGNSEGQLGDGTTTQRAKPEEIPGLAHITQIAAGNSASFALRSDGTLFAWGNNSEGQLGDGSTVSRSTPEPVPGLTGVVQVASGLDHTLAIVGTSHSVFAWGDNSASEIGDGTNVNRLSPVPLALSGVSQVAAGVFQSAAIRPDGTLLTWAGHITTPTTMSSLAGVTQVSLGDAIDLAIGQPTTATVPDLRGDSTARAGSDLQAAGLVLGGVGSAVDNFCTDIGTVLSQSPAAGTTVPIGSAVSITLGVRPKHPCP